MKKIIALLIVVSTCLFTVSAIGAVKVAPNYIFATGRALPSNNFSTPQYKAYGFGLSFALEYEPRDNIMLWSDTSALLYSNLKYGDYDFDAEFRELKRQAGSFAKVSKSALNFALGASRRFSFNRFTLAVGGGAFFEFYTLYMSDETFSKTTRFEIKNLGPCISFDCRYKLTESVGINLTAIAELGIYNSTYVYDTIGSLGGGYSKGTKFFSFTVPVTLGISYLF